MSEQELRQMLYDSIKNRAMMYYHIYKEAAAEVGEEKAVAILKRAIYKRGREAGRRFARFAPGDLKGLKDAFLDFVPDKGKMFEPEVERLDESGLDIKFSKCPLKDAYREAGLSDAEMAKMLEISSQVDYGTFEGAGFRFSAECWRPGQPECCRLHVRPGA